MKRLLRHYAVETFTLWLTSTLAAGMVFERGTITLLMTGLALTITALLAKPIVNILLLPLNLVTFGLFRWVSSAVVLYIVTLLIHNFRIAYFYFDGLSNKWLDIPPIHLSGILAFIGFSFLLSLISSFLYWLMK